MCPYVPNSISGSFLPSFTRQGVIPASPRAFGIAATSHYQGMENLFIVGGISYYNNATNMDYIDDIMSYSGDIYKNNGAWSPHTANLTQRCCFGYFQTYNAHENSDTFTILGGLSYNQTLMDDMITFDADPFSTDESEHATDWKVVTNDNTFEKRHSFGYGVIVNTTLTTTTTGGKNSTYFYLFGGSTLGVFPVYGQPSTFLLNDVWYLVDNITTSNTWVLLHNAPWTPRAAMATTQLQNIIYMFGGLDANGFALKDAYKFDGGKEYKK